MKFHLLFSYLEKVLNVSNFKQKCGCDLKSFKRCHPLFSGKNHITWINATSTRVIFAGNVNIFNDPKLEIGDGGKILKMSSVTADDQGDYICRVEMKRAPIELVHTLNVLGKLAKRDTIQRDKLW